MNEKKIIITDIEWDAPESANLPKEVIININKDNEYLLEDIDGYAENLCDYLSDTYEYCYSGFNIAHPDRSMGKDFFDITIGDIIIVHDEYSHDYKEHCFKVENIEYDEGMRCYGKDLDCWDEETQSYNTDDYIGVVTEGNFVRFQDQYTRKYLLNVTFYAGSDDKNDVDNGLFLMNTNEDKTENDIKEIFKTVNKLLDPYSEEEKGFPISYEDGLNITTLLNGVEIYTKSAISKVCNNSGSLGYIDSYYEIEQWQ